MAPAHPHATGVAVYPALFNCVLRNFTPRFVSLSIGPSVHLSVRLSVGPSFTLYFFGVYEVFGYTAPAQMLH